MNIQKLESQLMKAFVWVTGLSLLMPLVIFKNILRPYITSKMFFFGTLVLVMVGIWMLLLFLNPQKYKPRKNIILTTLLIYLGAIFLSVLFSENVFRSFWGNAERMEGFISFVFFGLFAVSTFSVLRERPEIVKKLIFASLAISLICALYPVFQKTGLFFAPPGEQYDRPGGSFGNPTFLSGYLMAHLFLCAWYFFKNLSKNKKIFTSSNITLATIFIVDFIVFVWTQTRGSWLGFFASLVVFAVLALFFLPKKVKIASATFLFLVVIGGTSFFVFRNQIKDSPIAQKIPIVNRLASISLQDSSSRARWLTWQWSLKWFQNKPIFGVGQDMFYSVFDNNYSADNNDLMSERFDRAHNKYIDLLVMNGIVGLGAYLLLLGALFWELFKKIKRSENMFSRAAWMSIISLLVAYMIHNFFVFDTPANSLVFYFLIGCLLILLNPSREGSEAKEVRKNIIPEKVFGLSVVLVISLGSIFYFAICKPYQAAALVAETGNTNSANISESLSYYQKALDKNSFIYNEVINLWSDSIVKSIAYSYTKKNLYSADSLKKAVNDLFVAMDKAEEREPVIDFYVYRTGVYTQMSWFKGFTAAEAKSYEDEAKKWYEKIAEKWPLRTDFLIARVEDQIYKGNYEEASRWLDLILSRTPNYGSALWLKGMINLMENNNVEEALQYINLAIDKGYRWDIGNRSDIIYSIAPKIKAGSLPLFVGFLENRLNAYNSDSDLSQAQTVVDLELRAEKIKMTANLLVQLSLELQPVDYNKIANYLSIAVKYDLKNPIYWSRLAAAYAKIHNKEGAIQAAQMALQLDPDNYATDAAAFINYVQSEQWDMLP